MRLDRGIISEALIYVALMVAVMTHVIDGTAKAKEDVWYMVVLFGCCIIGFLLLMAVIYLRPDKIRGWLGASLLALITIGCYVYSRTIGFPMMDDHVGDWGGLLGNVALVSEVAVVLIGTAEIMRLRNVKVPYSAAGIAASAVMAVALMPSAALGAESHMAPHTTSTMHMVGSMGDYPDMMSTSQATRLKLKSLVHRTWSQRGRFNAVSEAKRLGYSFYRPDDAFGWPSVRHMRKNGNRMWGRVLDVRRPQSLVFWCTSRSKCTLVASMYRAPKHMNPPTYGGLLAWHAHENGSTWMSHIWYTRSSQTALARCVPFAALAPLGVMQKPYFVDIDEDRPCSETPPMMP